MMARIGQRDTQPELAVRRSLHKFGYRFRLHQRDLPGRPDVVLPRHKTVVFVHGCFWHRHPGCKYAATPSTNPDFWQRKLQINVVRDERIRESLQQAGWRVLIIWECEIAPRRLALLLRRVRSVRIVRSK